MLFSVLGSKMILDSLIYKSVTEILYDLSDRTYYREDLKYSVNPVAIFSFKIFYLLLKIYYNVAGATQEYS